MHNCMEAFGRLTNHGEAFWQLRHVAGCVRLNRAYLLHTPQMWLATTIVTTRRQIRYEEISKERIGKESTRIMY